MSEVHEILHPQLPFLLDTQRRIVSPISVRIFWTVCELNGPPPGQSSGLQFPGRLQLPCREGSDTSATFFLAVCRLSSQPQA